MHEKHENYDLTPNKTQCIEQLHFSLTQLSWAALFLHFAHLFIIFHCNEKSCCSLFIFVLSGFCCFCYRITHELLRSTAKVHPPDNCVIFFLFEKKKISNDLFEPYLLDGFWFAPFRFDKSLLKLLQLKLKADCDHWWTWNQIGSFYAFGTCSHFKMAPFFRAGFSRSIKMFFCFSSTKLKQALRVTRQHVPRYFINADYLNFKTRRVTFKQI